MCLCGLAVYAVCRTVFFCILVHAYCSYLTDLYDYFASFFGDYCMGNSGLFESVPPLRHDALADILCFFCITLVTSSNIFKSLISELIGLYFYGVGMDMNFISLDGLEMANLLAADFLLSL